MSEVYKNFEVAEGCLYCFEYKPVASVPEEAAGAARASELARSARAMESARAVESARAMESARAAEAAMQARCEEMLRQAQNGAKAIAEEAGKSSKKLLENARRQIEDERRAALEQARCEGYEKGRQEALDGVSASLGELQELIQSMERQKSKVLEDFEDSLKTLSLTIAGKVLNYELDRSDEAFLSIYKNTVQEFNNPEWVKVTVSEREEAFATTHAELLRSLAKGAKTIRITALRDAPRGTLLVETPQSVADAGVETQLGRIREAFADVAASV